MLERGLRITGLVGALLAAAGWALAVTLLQPLTETGYETAAPNEYWARDLRWTVLLAVCGGLVAALRPTVRGTAAIAGLGIVLLAVDVAVDRAGMTGPVAAAVLLPAAVCAVAGLWWVVRARSDRAGRGPVLACAALVAAATPLAPFVTAVTEAAPHPALAPAGRVAGALLAAVAVAAAAVAGDAPVRRGPLAALILIAVACVAAPGDFLVVSVLGALLLTAVTVVTSRIGSGRAVLLLSGLVLAYPAALVALRLLTAPLGALMTGLSGGPAQTPADDVIFVPAIALGLGGAYAAALVASRFGDRPRPWLLGVPAR